MKNPTFKQIFFYVSKVSMFVFALGLLTIFTYWIFHPTLTYMEVMPKFNDLIIAIFISSILAYPQFYSTNFNR